MEGLKLAIEESQLLEYKSIQEIPGLDPGYVLDRTTVEDGTVSCVSLACDEGCPVLHLRIITDEGDLVVKMQQAHLRNRSVALYIRNRFIA